MSGGVLQGRGLTKRLLASLCIQKLPFGKRPQGGRSLALQVARQATNCLVAVMHAFETAVSQVVPPFSYKALVGLNRAPFAR